MQNIRSPLTREHRRSKIRRLRGKSAFTLTEVMIAFTIMIAVLCGSLTAMQSGFKAIDTARCSTLAAQIMQSRIEQLRLSNWNEIQAAMGDKTYTQEAFKDLSLVPEEAEEIAGRFTLREVIETVPDRTNIVDISLTVTWTGLGNASLSRNYKTRYAKNGLYDYYY